jgi:spore maturation protein CgeB
LNRIKKILLFHTNSQLPEQKWHLDRAKTWTAIGYQTEVVTLPKNLKFRYFKPLEKLWLSNDEDLLNFYKLLINKINQCDLFIHFGGGMIYPEILKKINIKVIKVYHCADDPESSHLLSKPVAKYYDYCAISNIAEIQTYKSWGVKNVFFWPLGAINYKDEYFEKIENSSFEQRKHDIGFIGSKYGTPKFGRIGKFLGLYNKKTFMNRLLSKVPQLIGYGTLWDNGYIKSENILDFYINIKMGINIHNSTGPINSRLFDLNAFGICQICDNKSFLGKIYELDKEVIGFNNIDEAIFKIQYYLENEHEAQEIAFNGRKRFLKNYTSSEILNTLLKELNNNEIVKQ